MRAHHVVFVLIVSAFAALRNSSADAALMLRKIIEIRP
jgi:hypothetical protein